MFFFKRIPARKTIQNAKLKEDSDEEAEIPEEDEPEINEETDLCVAGTITGVCYNCNKVRHLSCDCKELRKSFNQKKPFTPKKLFFNPKNKAKKLVKDIRNLDMETHKALLNVFKEEGF